MIVSVHDFAAGKDRELAVFPFPPLSRKMAPGEERSVVVLDVFDPAFRMELSERGAVQLITLLEMAVERLP